MSTTAAQTAAQTAPQPGATAPAVLRFDEVHAAYGQFKALFGVSFEVGQGQALALIGPNGAGKTTVARVASGLVAPSRGRVEVGGVDFSGKPAQAFARAGVAHAPEGRSVFATLDVEENLSLPFRRQFGRKGLPGSLERAYSLFPKLGERRHQNAGSLSGGEQRMLTLACVLVQEPRLLVADELSLGLAPIITNEIYDVLRRILASGTALLVVEQHVDRALDLADDVVVLERGEVLHHGQPSRQDILTSVFGTTEVVEGEANPATAENTVAQPPTETTTGEPGAVEEVEP